MENSVQHFCPHLGLKSDPTTSFSFPSKGNVCFHAKGRPTPKLCFQRSTCLTDQHLNCPIFSSPTGVRLPANLKAPKEKKENNQKIILWAILTPILISSIFLTYTYRLQLFNQIDRMLVPAWKNTQQALPPTFPPSPTLVVVPRLTITPTVTGTATPTSEPTQTLIPSLTQTPTRGPVVLELGTPIGKQGKFVIIRVLEGESIGQFAGRYNTTEEAIRAINYKLPSVLYPDWLLVVPLDFSDTTGLPSFQPIQVTTDGITLLELAQLLNMEAEEISRYNNMGPGHPLQQGEWILIPHY
ncbi:MAG TPA: LysM peptidoglycan-binding domain-containing protein [Brevefilum sp.]|nr:LysM peptidoglycan-binding domain-containing protein [Brevefilum sp.]HPL70006.1 LysM peptidoglycan-binding domain-containing protein [Brevefilum sp.]